MIKKLSVDGRSVGSCYCSTLSMKRAFVDLKHDKVRVSARAREQGERHTCGHTFRRLTGFGVTPGSSVRSKVLHET